MANSQKSLVKSREIAFSRQKGRCYYCKCSMWAGNPGEFAQKYKLTRSQVMRFQCTAEHLIARRDGGGWEQSNIVAACRYCNQQRHKGKGKTPERYKSFVRQRMSQGRWHGIIISNLLVYNTRQ